MLEYIAGPRSHGLAVHVDAAASAALGLAGGSAVAVFVFQAEPVHLREEVPPQKNQARFK